MGVQVGDYILIGPVDQRIDLQFALIGVVGHHWGSGSGRGVNTFQTGDPGILTRKSKK